MRAPSPIKRSRRTKTEVETLDIAIYEIVPEYKPVTVRQAYYLLVSAGAINKTEAEYKNIGRRLGILRRDHTIPFGWIADNTRWHDRHLPEGALAELEVAEDSEREILQAFARDAREFSI